MCKNRAIEIIQGAQSLKDLEILRYTIWLEYSRKSMYGIVDKE